MAAKTASALRAEPLKYNGALDPSDHRKITPVFGEVFPDFELADVLRKSEPERDAILQDIAILVARRGVVVFKRQDSLSPEQLAPLVDRLGSLLGKPAESRTHIHPIRSDDYNEDGTKKTSVEGERITNVVDKRGALLNAPDERSKLASAGWHTDITFEPVPADFTILRMETLPPCGGDTMFASSYEAYDRLSPSLRAYLETLTVTNDAYMFREQAKRHNFRLFAGPRGHPDNVGDEVVASHPLVRTIPATGWKALFTNACFSTRINELNKDESDVLLKYLFRLVADNHDLQLRHTWDLHDTVIWHNGAVQHSATFDVPAGSKRSGDRAVSLGEHPYFDPASRSRGEAFAAGEDVD